MSPRRGLFEAFLTKRKAEPRQRGLIHADHLSNYSRERLACVKDGMKESQTDNRRHTHLLSDGIQAGSSPRCFGVVALGTVRGFCLYNKPRRCVCSKAGALGAGLPAADTPGENVSLQLFPRFNFFAPLLLGAPAVARKKGCLPCPGEEEVGWDPNPQRGFQWAEGALLWPSTFKAPLTFQFRF